MCKINIFWFVNIVFILFIGCHDFLEEKDPSNFNVDNYFTKPAHARASVNAIYNSLYPIHNQQSWLMTELRTGILNSTFAADGGFPSFRIVSELGMDADHPSLNVYWDSHYRGIGNANIAISQIPKITMDENEKTKILGEAKFLRAYFYFNLVRLFGDVPLITESITLDHSQLKPKRDPVELIYSLIVNDLKEAETSGLPFTSNSGKVSLGAVKSLLAKVYITMAGYPLNMGQEYYALAKKQAKEVIDSEEFYLFDNYEDFRKKENDNRGEYIFEVQFDELDMPSNALQIGLVPFKLGISAYSSEQGFSFARPEFINSYEANDLRADEKQFFYTKYTLESNRQDTINLGEYYIYKFFDENAHLYTARSGLNWQVIRYADILLDFAEASNEIEGPTEEGVLAVNLIRKRANIEELKIETLSKSEFESFIMKERWHEFCYESKIWFDMVRKRIGYDFEKDEIVDFVGYTFPGGKTLQEKHLLYPIPTTEIRNNPNLTQNNGY